MRLLAALACLPLALCPQPSTPASGAAEALSAAAQSTPPAPPAPPASADPVMPAKAEPTHKTPAGLEYCVLAGGGEGPRAIPQPGDKVKVHYSGWFTDGKLFDSSVKNGKPFEFVLGVGQVIEGWDMGVALMGKGERYRFEIPSDLAYGDKGRGPIPGKATLVFEVELLDFGPWKQLPAFVPMTAERQQRAGSGLRYELVAEGQGEKIKPEQVLELRYALWSPRGALVDCSEFQAPLRGTASDLPLEFLKELVPLMRVGSRMLCEVPAEVCSVGQGQRPRLPAGSPTVWLLELLSVRDPLPLPPFYVPEGAKLQKTGSGLAYEVIRPGTGAVPKSMDTVRVHYAGWLTDGTLFDSSYGRAEPSEFAVNRVIRGWTEGLQLMQEGATVRFLIPAAIAYGAAGNPPRVPANADLVFHVELLAVVPPAPPGQGGPR